LLCCCVVVLLCCCVGVLVCCCVGVLVCCCVVVLFVYKRLMVCCIYDIMPQQHIIMNPSLDHTHRQDKEWNGRQLPLQAHLAFANKIA
jgi:hypothetical protein